MNIGRWISRHAFFLAAVLLAAGLFALAAFGSRYVTVSPQAVLPEGDEFPFPIQSCQFGPLYDLNGSAHDTDVPYTGPAPLYALPGEALGVTPPDCQFPTTITPTLVTAIGASHYPIHLEALTPGEWMRVGESTTLEAVVRIDETFSGARPLNQEAVAWTASESRQVSFAIAAPNFDYSPSNEEIRPQSLARNRPARQLWIIAPRGNVSGDQVINILLDDPITRMPVTFAYLWLNVRHPTGIDPVIVTLIAAVGLAVGWVLDRVKTVYEIRKMAGGEHPADPEA